MELFEPLKLHDFDSYDEYVKENYIDRDLDEIDSI